MASCWIGGILCKFVCTRVFSELARDTHGGCAPTYDTPSHPHSVTVRVGIGRVGHTIAQYVLAPAEGGGELRRPRSGPLGPGLLRASEVGEGGTLCRSPLVRNPEIHVKSSARRQI